MSGAQFQKTPTTPRVEEAFCFFLKQLFFVMPESDTRNQAEVLGEEESLEAE